MLSDKLSIIGILTAPTTKLGQTRKTGTQMELARRMRERQQESSIDDEPERDVWAGNYSAKTMIGSWIGGGVVTLLAPLAVQFMPNANNQTVWLVLTIGLLSLWILSLIHI